VGYAALLSESGALPEQLVTLAVDEAPAVREAVYSTARDWARANDR
jgi:hypothetical protein